MVRPAVEPLAARGAAAAAAALRPVRSALLADSRTAAAAVAVLGGGRILGALACKLLARLLARTPNRWDDALVERIKRPLALAIGLGVLALAASLLGLHERAQDWLLKAIRAGFLIALFWAALRSVDVAKGRVSEVVAERKASVRSLVPVGAQIVKVGIVAAAAMTILAEMGYPVTSLIAGLGIGGVAIALAAQKTVENLFGSLSIGLDQPFRVGDFVKVEETVGTVETVGLRSTRIRTLDRTLVTIPNGKLADMLVETFTARDRFRLHCVLGVEYGTTPATIRKVVAGVQEVLDAEPTYHKGAGMVVMKELGASSVDIEVMAWFETKDYDAFLQVRHDVLLAFMEVVGRCGTSFAFPTRTVHLIAEAKDGRASSGRGAPQASASAPPSPG